MKKQKSVSDNAGKDETQVIGFDAPKKMVQELDEIAEEQLTSRSTILRRLFKRAIELEKAEAK